MELGSLTFAHKRRVLVPTMLRRRQQQLHRPLSKGQSLVLMRVVEEVVEVTLVTRTKTAFGA